RKVKWASCVFWGRPCFGHYRNGRRCLSAIIENRPAVIGRRARVFISHESLDRGPGSVTLQLPCRVVQALERRKLFLASELRLLHRRFQDADRLVVDTKRHPKRMARLGCLGTVTPA